MGYALGHNQSNSQEGDVRAEPRKNSTASDPIRMQTLVQRMAELEARLGRLNALGERVADIAQVDAETVPTPKLPAPHVLAMGGPDSSEAQVPRSEDIYAAIDRLTREIDDREQQFDNIEEILTNRKVGERALYGAQPVYRGEISSYFGMRFDPFSGRRSMHEGIDFSGRAGSAILAAADGVVSFAGDKQGYGRVIEINHGDDCFTRYAHSKLIFVKQGDIVKKGQVIALMGSSGRATGAHLHFEVYKHGRPVDPFIYISQASR